MHPRVRILIDSVLGRVDSDGAHRAERDRVDTTEDRRGDYPRPERQACLSAIAASRHREKANGAAEKYKPLLLEYAKTWMTKHEARLEWKRSKIDPNSSRFALEAYSTIDFLGDGYYVIRCSVKFEQGNCPTNLVELVVGYEYVENDRFAIDQACDSRFWLTKEVAVQPNDYMYVEIDMLSSDIESATFEVFPIE